MLESAILLIGIVLLSGAFGYLLGNRSSEPTALHVVPASFDNTPAAGKLDNADTAVTGGDKKGLVANDVATASQVGNTNGGNTIDDMLNREIGRIRAQIVQLRVLFARLADLAELDDGEFDLESEPLSAITAEYPENLSLVKQDLNHISEQTDKMQRIYMARRLRHDFRVSGLPVIHNNISSRFGFRDDPDTGTRKIHRGLDFVGAVGDPVFALADGIVTYSGTNGGYGNLVEVEHGNGFLTRYAHNDSNLVRLGERVLKGQTIATLGSTGRSTGPHLHVEVRQFGKALDPQFFIR